MLDQVTLYDALYLLAAGEGRQDALFGNCQPLAREAFRRSLIGEEFPTVWFEVPLAGEPRFDLHVAHSRAALVPGVRFAAGAGMGYDELFRWYAEEEAGGAGLAFAYDVSEGHIDEPAVHVNVNGASLDHMDRFFELVVNREAGANANANASEGAGRRAAERYRAFEGWLPQGWRVWYAGFHPGRPGAPVRVDCFVGAQLKAAYASVPSLLEAHLRECGFAASSAALRDVAALVTTSPFALELQFDVLEDGTVGPTIGVSAGFTLASASHMRPLFERGGAAAELLERIEARGLADNRWQRLPETMFATATDTPNGVVALYNAPTFVKLRVRDGQPFDAKIYLQAGCGTTRFVRFRQ